MFSPNKKLITLLLVTCVLSFVFFLSLRQAAYSLRTFTADAAKLPLLAGDFLSHELRAVLFFHRSYWDKMQLLHRNEELETELLRTRRITEENERLAGLLELKTRSSFRTLASRVIGKDFSTFRSYLILDRGRASGIEKYAPVLTPLGLVGKVLEVGRFSSKVILINDPDLSIPAVLLRTQEQGLVCGSLDGRCKLRFLDLDSDVKEGDLVATSGLNMTYPQGILIGRVKLVGVESSGLGKFAIVEPAVRVSSVAEVLVVLLFPAS